MYSQEQRKVAIETLIKFDYSYADTVAELGYPTSACLRIWWNEYESDYLQRLATFVSGATALPISHAAAPVFTSSCA